MANSIITAAGLALFAQALKAGTTVPVDRMIFADIPGLDTDADPDPDQSLPEAHIVFNAEIQTSGKIDDRTVVYSRILSASDGDFFLNWIGLYSSEYETLVAVCQVPRHKKYKTSGFQAGNTLYKNFALQFANAAQLTGISIAPETWQYDFDSRYAAISHNHEIGQVNGLQTALNEKAAASHNHEIGQVNGLQTALNEKAAKADLNSHNQNLNSHPSGFAKLTTTDADAVRMKYGGYGVLLRNDGGSFHLLLTDANDADGSYNSLRPLSINLTTGFFVSNGVHLYDGQASMKRLVLAGLSEQVGGEIYGKDANGINRGCFRIWQNDSGGSEISMIVYDSAGNSGGHISFVNQGGGSYSFLSVCNGTDQEIARCDWVKNQIAANISKSPGYPNYAAGIDIQSAYTDGGKSYTFTSDGWVYARANMAGKFYINGGTCPVVQSSDASQHGSFLPVKSGDVISGGGAKSMYFFPNR